MGTVFQRKRVGLNMARVAEYGSITSPHTPFNEEIYHQPGTKMLGSGQCGNRNW